MLSALFFFFNDTATTEIYTLSLHDALPIYHAEAASHIPQLEEPTTRNIQLCTGGLWGEKGKKDRKSTRLNSSHANISYAVFCLKKKKKKQKKPLCTEINNKTTKHSSINYVT